VECAVRWSVGIEAQGDGVLTREQVVEKATEEFWRAVRKARLRPGPVVRTEAVSEDEDAAG